MSQMQRNELSLRRAMTDSLISRRSAIGSAGLALAGALAGAAMGQQESKTREAGGAADAGRGKARERTEEARAMLERLRDGGREEMMKMMADRQEQQRRQGIENFKDTLGISDTEWPVLKPRIEAVYNLVRPAPQVRGNAGGQSRTEVDQKSAELRDLLRDEKATPEQIRAGLTALRSAKEKASRQLATARQNLRQVMTLRQEAQLVLADLLD